MSKARILNEYHIKELILRGNPQYENFYKEELIEFCKISKQEIDRLNNIIYELEKYIVEEIDDAQEELNTILQGNDLDYKNECTKEFNCIRNALDMLLDKIKELKDSD